VAFQKFPVGSTSVEWLTLSELPLSMASGLVDETWTLSSGAELKWQSVSDLLISS